VKNSGVSSQNPEGRRKDGEQRIEYRILVTQLIGFRLQVASYQFLWCRGVLHTPLMAYIKL